MNGLFKKEDIVEVMACRREREPITAASAAYLNTALEPTAYSFGSATLRLRFRRRLTASVRR